MYNLFFNNLGKILMSVLLFFNFEALNALIYNLKYWRFPSFILEN